MDATAHHLGDEVSTAAPMLDPPDPEGGVLEKTIELQESPGGSWALVLDVVDVAGEEAHDYSDRVKNGEFRTYAADQRPAHRLREPAHQDPEREAGAGDDGYPRWLLHLGKNTIRLELTGAGRQEHPDRRPGRAANGPRGDCGECQGRRSTERTAMSGNRLSGCQDAEPRVGTRHT